MKFQKSERLLPLLGLMASIFTACQKQEASSASTESPGERQKPLKFHLVTHGMPSDIFWTTVAKGWYDACKLYNIDGQMVNVRVDGNVAEMLNNLETVIASGSDGIACVITDQNALEKPLRRAISGGIPVIAVNIAPRPQGHL